MTSVLALPSFKNIAAGIVGLIFALGLFFTAATPAQATGLTDEQIQAVINLLVAFDVEESAISNVSNILNEGQVSEPSSATTDMVVSAASNNNIAVAPACPELLPGVESATATNETGSCTVTTNASQAVAIAHPATPVTQVPDVAGLMASAAMAPYYTLVDLFTEIFVSLGMGSSDVASAPVPNLVATVAMAPWNAAVDSLSTTLFAAGIY